MLPCFEILKLDYNSLIIRYKCSIIHNIYLSIKLNRYNVSNLSRKNDKIV